MAKMVKKKKKLGASGTAKQEQSPLRPSYVPKIPPCTDSCPSSEPIRTYLTLIAQSEEYGRTMDESTEQAFYELVERNPFPSTMGRVCPHPCETGCNRGQFDTPVAINNVERYIGDFGLEKGLKLKKLEGNFSGKIAVVGAGPAGLSCAYQLARLGYSVTVFEQFNKGGGMCLWGIPRYRLAWSTLEAEIKRIEDLGVEIKYNTKVGKDISIDDLKKDYQAIFLGIGAHKGKKLGVEGEEAPNVLTGAEFLNEHHQGVDINVGKKVLVIGGGDTAIDCARVCRRKGAEVTLVYRRTRNEMPAIDEEIEGALHEGVELMNLTAPIGFVKDGDKATGMKCLKMELGEPDDSGRRRPVKIEGSDFIIDADTVIAAISQEPDFVGFENFIEGRDWIKVNETTRMTKVDGVFAGGDVLDLDLVTTAVGHGRMAAEAMHAYVQGQDLVPFPEMPIVTYDKLNVNYYKKADRNERTEVPVEKALSGFDEITIGLTPDQVMAEAKRCFSCGNCFDCNNCWTYCQDGVIEKLPKGQHFAFSKLEKCIGCKKCAEECPCGLIDMN